MNWLAFSAAVIQGLAWPAVVLVLGLVFRTQIRALLARPLERLEVGPFKASWLRILAEVEAHVEERPAHDSNKGADLPAGEVTTLKTLVRTDPPAAVFAAHEIVYRRLQAITGQELGSPPLPRTVAALARDARDRGLISSETLRAIEGITVLRNLAAHGAAGEVTSDRAQEYVAQMEAILVVLEEAPKHPGKDDS